VAAGPEAGAGGRGAPGRAHRRGGGRPLWNPVGQVFFASFAAAALAHLSFAANVTFAGGLAPAGVVASALLLVLETAVLVLSGSFAIKSCDMLSRVRWSRLRPLFDPAYRPKVSQHVPAYNEPPDMFIETIRSLDRLDYPELRDRGDRPQHQGPGGLAAAILRPPRPALLTRRRQPRQPRRGRHSRRPQLDLLPPTTSGLTTTGPTPTGPAGPTTTASASGQRS
jgi:hypothetical protein